MCMPFSPGRAMVAAPERGIEGHDLLQLRQFYKRFAEGGAQ